MANFTVRVELHGADAEDYDELHEKMESKGFKRTIMSSDTTYQLPSAEYNYNGNNTCQEVLTKAHDVAKSVKSKPSILVTESAGRCWRGLDQA